MQPADLRILVVRSCAIGDFVLNLPALRALSVQYPAARFTLIGYPAILEIARRFIPVEAIHSIDVPPWSLLFHGVQGGLGFDRAFVWMKDPVVAENLRGSGIPNVSWGNPFPLPGPVPEHAAEHLLRMIGLPSPELPDLWAADSDLVLIHPGSGSPAKVWPYFQQLADKIANVAAIIGPCEEQFRGSCLQLTGLRLTDVAEALCRCRVFIGNDSGITHLAAYLGCPTVALFGPTDPRVWGPVGRRVEILWKSALADISPEEVIQRL